MLDIRAGTPYHIKNHALSLLNAYGKGSDARPGPKTSEDSCCGRRDVRIYRHPGSLACFVPDPYCEWKMWKG